MNQHVYRPRYSARLSLCAGLAVSAAALAAPPDSVNNNNVGQFDNLIIAGTQNIFSAGRTEPWGPNCQVTAKDTNALAAGTLPKEIAVPPNAVWVSFETVTESSPIGSVDFNVDSHYYSGDGWSASGADSTNIFGPYWMYAPDGSGKWTRQMVSMDVDISGIQAPGTMFLTGAFRDASVPTNTYNPNIRNYWPAGWTAGTIYKNLTSPAFGGSPSVGGNPAVLGEIQQVFAETNKETYTDLQLNQSYWIGDGRDQFEVMAGQNYRSESNIYPLGPAAKGKVQYFKIPKGATRLYLGFSDSNGFYGVPGCYWDNPGALTVSGTFWGPKQPVLTVACTPTALNDSPGNIATCTITSDDVAPTGGLSVALTPPPGGPRYSTTCASPLTILEGQKTAQCTITAIANTIVGDGSVDATLTLLAGIGYTLGATPSATVTIHDDDKVASVQPVPTLGEWALMLLSLGVAGFAARRVRLR